jgi:hypothetical protein
MSHPETASDTGTGDAVAVRPLHRRLRLSGVLLILGLLVEGATLFALDRPVGFLTFAGAGGLLVAAGIALYLWAIVSQA